MIRHWLAFPLLEKKKSSIAKPVVTGFLKHLETHEQIEEALSSLSDMERISARIATYKVSPKALIHLLATLEMLGPIQTTLQASKQPALVSYSKGFRRLPI